MKRLSLALCDTHTYPLPSLNGPPTPTPSNLPPQALSEAPFRGSYDAEMHRQNVANLGKLPKLKLSQAQMYVDIGASVLHHRTHETTTTANNKSLEYIRHRRSENGRESESRNIRQV